MIKAVLLDSDDTLLDFTKAEHIALSKTLASMGIEPSDEMIALYSGINKRHWEMLERGELTRPQVLVKRFEALYETLGMAGNAEATQASYEHNLSIGHYFMPGAVELLEALYGKYKLYMVTNGNEKVQVTRLASAGIEKYFEDIFISQRVGFDKPRIEYFQRCFEKMPAFEPDEMIIIGDSLTSDIQGGINAGIHTCWYNFRGAAPRPGIEPEFVVRGLEEISALLEKL